MARKLSLTAKTIFHVNTAFRHLDANVHAAIPISMADLLALIKALHNERDYLDRIIAALEPLVEAPSHHSLNALADVVSKTPKRKTRQKKAPVTVAPPSTQE
jgi:hypothetical protein